jgi:threonine dehydrogenase-like Zn-dependent dehydrogenase
MGVDVWLRAEQLVLEAEVTTAHIPAVGPNPVVISVRWFCLCGTTVDTADHTADDRRVSLGDGCLIRCPGCGRVYHYRVAQRIVEG